MSASRSAPDRRGLVDSATLLAFDHGLKRIGVAVGQTVTGTATPLETVSARDGGPDWSVIDELVSAWCPEALVVGLPLNMDGTEQAMTRAARRFGRRLQARYRLPVHWADERLSTREARERLALEGRPSPDDDAVAAQVILEGWLARPVPVQA